VDVVSVNKFRPQFTRKVFTANVSESLPIGTRILQLNATDNDHNQNLYYSFHNAQSLVSLKIFSVNYQNGTISLAESLDRWVKIDDDDLTPIAVHARFADNWRQRRPP